MSNVKVVVEYCGSCGHHKQFLEMSKIIKEAVPDAEIIGETGRQASFEIKVNEELIYSKLETMAFPEFSEVADVVKDVSEGQSVRAITKQQPIDCIIF